MDPRKLAAALAPLGILAGFAFPLEVGASRLRADEPRPAVQTDDTVGTPVIQPVEGRWRLWPRSSQQQQQQPQQRMPGARMMQPQVPLEPTPENRYHAGAPTPAVVTSPSTPATRRAPTTVRPEPAAPSRLPTPVAPAPVRAPAARNQPTPVEIVPEGVAAQPNEMEKVPVRAKQDFQPSLAPVSEGPTLFAPGPGETTKPKTVVIDERESLPIAVSPPVAPPEPQSVAVERPAPPPTRTMRPSGNGMNQPEKSSMMSRFGGWFTPVWRR